MKTASQVLFCSGDGVFCDGMQGVEKWELIVNQWLIIFFFYFLFLEKNKVTKKIQEKTKFLRSLEIYCFIFRELGKLFKTLPSSCGNFKHASAGSPFFLAIARVAPPQIMNYEL